MKEEIKAIFNYFDKEQQNCISYNNFISCLNREHLDLINISKRMIHYFESHDKKLSDLFNVATQGKRDYLIQEDLDKMMAEIGYNFNKEQIEELFC